MAVAPPSPSSPTFAYLTWGFYDQREVTAVHFVGAAQAVEPLIILPPTPPPTVPGPPDYATLGSMGPSRTVVSQSVDVGETNTLVWSVGPAVRGIAVEFRLRAATPNDPVAVTFIEIFVTAEPTVTSISVDDSGVCDSLGQRNFTLRGAELHLTGTPLVSVNGSPATVLAVQHNDGSPSALDSTIVAQCPTNVSGTALPVVVHLPDLTPAVGSVTLDYEPPVVDALHQPELVPPAGGTALYILGSGWGTGTPKPTVRLDGNLVPVLDANETVITAVAPAQGAAASSPVATAITVEHAGVVSVATVASLLFAEPTISSVVLPGDALASPLPSDQPILIVGQHFGTASQPFELRVGSTLTVPAAEVVRHNDTHMTWTPTDTSIVGRAHVGCGDGLVVVRQGSVSTTAPLTWQAAADLSSTSAFLSTNPLGYIEVAGSNLGPPASSHLVVVDANGEVAATLSVVAGQEYSTSRRLFRLPTGYAFTTGQSVRYTRCDGAWQSDLVPLATERSGTSSSCIVYLSPPTAGEAPRWWLNGEPLADAPTDAHCRAGDRLVFGWDFAPFANQTASACVRDGLGGPDCSASQPPLGGSSQFDRTLQGGTHCGSLGDPYEGDVVSVAAGQCVFAAPASGNSQVCLTAQLSGDNLVTPERTTACVFFSASTDAVACQQSDAACTSTCGEASPPGTCEMRTSATSGATADACRPAVSCTCQCAYDADAPPGERYLSVAADFVPLVAGWQALTTTTTTTVPSATVGLTTPDAADALAAFVYALVTLQGEPPFVLTSLPGPPLDVFAYRAGISPQKRSAVVSPVDATFDPLRHIDYARGLLVAGDSVDDDRLILRARQAGPGPLVLPGGNATLAYEDKAGVLQNVTVDGEVLARAVDSRGTEAQSTDGDDDAASLQPAELVLMLLGVFGCMAVAVLVVQRARSRGTGGASGTAPLTASRAGDVELARSDGAATRTGDEHAYSSPPLSSTPAHSSGTVASGVTGTTSVGSATDGRSTDGQGGSDDVEPPYVLPPVMGSDDDLRDRARASVPRKFLILPEDIDRGRLVGHGGYGYVYAGVWREVAVAIKEIREVPDPAVSREAVKQMVEEALLMVELRPHTNLIQFFGICLDPMSIVLEFAARGALEDALYGKAKERRIDFTPEQRLAIAVGAGRGVNHLHQEGVVHRDIASRNVLLTDALVPKLTDFGMAREGEEDEERTTATRVGPIRWMAPEQLADQVVSTASDVWAFGCLLYEVYACEQPFGSSLKNMLVAKRVMDGGHVEVPEDAPDAVRAAMDACFVADRRERAKMKTILVMLEQ